MPLLCCMVSTLRGCTNVAVLISKSLQLNRWIPMRIQAQRAYQGQEREICYLMYVEQFILV